MLSLNVIFLGGNKEKIEKLFPILENEIDISVGKIQKRIYKSKIHESFFGIFGDSFSWRASLFPELTKENKSKILKDEIFEKIFLSKDNTKYVIIAFNDSFVKEIKATMNKINAVVRPFMLFVLNKETIDEKIFEGFSEPRKVGVLKSDLNDDITYSKIFSYLWSKFTYYNELGNLSNKHFSIEQKLKGLCHINVLLIGESRAGKSTLINLMAGKLVAPESPDTKSVTKVVTEYEVFLDENEKEINNKTILQDSLCGFKFFDTPGLVKEKELNSFQVIKDKIDIEKQINIIYFLTKNNPNLTNSLDMLKYINDINKKKEKEKKQKIPIIFIINGEINKKEEKESVTINAIKEFLKKNNLDDLYDQKFGEDETETQKEDDFFDEPEDGNNSFNQDGNMIKVNLMELEHVEVYGIDHILKCTLKYIQNNNSFDKAEFNSCKVKSKKLIEFFLKEEKKKIGLTKEEKKDCENYYDETNKIIEKFSLSYNLLSNKDKLIFKKSGK